MTDYTNDVAANNLIAASKVESTNVYNRQGESLGCVMLDKNQDGCVRCHVIGGFLGMGQCVYG